MTDPMGRRSRLRKLWDNLVVRVAGYYVVLVAVGVTIGTRYPGFARHFVGVVSPPGGGTRTEMFVENALTDTGIVAQTISAVMAMVVSFLLALPVAWLYVLTRQKKGYRQSVVQTLITLPVVVAGVVVLVKTSLALAFSLAGIMAAVRFRNTLEDSKDAVYIFLAISIGLAAGVQLGVAVALSVIFNVVILVLWYSDFGRTPTAFEGGIAERRLEQARAFANRTSSFVAKLDEEVLQSMSSDQLDALAERTWRRRKRNAPDDVEEEKDKKVKFDALMRVRTTDVDAAMRVTEPLLPGYLKRWQCGGVIHEDDGSHVVEYSIRLRKGMEATALATAIRTAAGPTVLDVELR